MLYLRKNVLLLKIYKYVHYVQNVKANYVFNFNYLKGNINEVGIRTHL